MGRIVDKLGNRESINIIVTVYTMSTIIPKEHLKTLYAWCFKYPNDNAIIYSPQERSNDENRDGKADSRSSVVQSNDKTFSTGAVNQRVVFTVEVVDERVDDGEVEQVEVETTIAIRLNGTTYPVAVRPVVEPVLRPADHTVQFSSVQFNV